MPKISVKVGSADPQEPVEFELEGFDTDHRPIQPITFRCMQEMQGVNLVKLFQGDAFAAGTEAIVMIERCILDEYKPLWQEITTGKKIIVNLESLSMIAKGLVEAYSGNPSNGPGGSQRGVSPTGPISMDAYLSAPEPTLRPSTVVASSTPPTQ